LFNLITKTCYVDCHNNKTDVLNLLLLGLCTKTGREFLSNFMHFEVMLADVCLFLFPERQLTSPNPDHSSFKLETNHHQLHEHVLVQLSPHQSYCRTPSGQ
jgi:hypothetical protein